MATERTDGRKGTQLGAVRSCQLGIKWSTRCSSLLFAPRKDFDGPFGRKRVANGFLAKERMSALENKSISTGPTFPPLNAAVCGWAHFRNMVALCNAFRGKIGQTPGKEEEEVSMQQRRKPSTVRQQHPFIFFFLVLSYGSYGSYTRGGQIDLSPTEG